MLKVSRTCSSSFVNSDTIQCAYYTILIDIMDIALLNDGGIYVYLSGIQASVCRESENCC